MNRRNDINVKRLARSLGEEWRVKVIELEPCPYLEIDAFHYVEISGAWGYRNDTPVDVYIWETDGDEYSDEKLLKHYRDVPRDKILDFVNSTINEIEQAAAKKKAYYKTV